MPRRGPGIKFVHVGCTFLTSGAQRPGRKSANIRREEEGEEERESRPVAKLQFFLEEGERIGEKFIL